MKGATEFYGIGQFILVQIATTMPQSSCRTCTSPREGEATTEKLPRKCDLDIRASIDSLFQTGAKQWNGVVTLTKRG
jgi:hypothetical protein